MKQEEINGNHSLSHIAADGHARMVDVSQKLETSREASARCQIIINQELAEVLTHRNALTLGINGKGPVFQTAELAGIMAAKRTHELIPLCHSLPLSKIEVRLEWDHCQKNCITVSATAKTLARTGVEMEALTAAAVAALCFYDMCKSVTHEITISQLQLIQKSGGKLGQISRAIHTTLTNTSQHFGLSHELKTQNLTGVLLAGGKSTRMGTDKAWLKPLPNGITENDSKAARYPFLWQRLMNHLKQLCLTPSISCSEAQADEFLRFGIPVAIDPICDGPVHAIAQALIGLSKTSQSHQKSVMNGDHPYSCGVIIIACDLWQLEAKDLKFLVSQRDSSKYATAFVSPDNQPEPLVAIWEEKALPELLKFIAAGGRCPRKFLSQVPIHRVFPQSLHAIYNANSPEDLLPQNPSVCDSLPFINDKKEELIQ